MAMTCSNCAKIRGGHFCFECGSRLVETPDTRRCPHCTIEVRPKDHFCFACGWDLASIPAKTPEMPAIPTFWRRLLGARK